MGCIHQTWTCLCSIINYSSCPLPHCILNIYLICYLFQKVGCRGYDPSAKKTLKICKTKKIQSPNNPSKSKSPKICKTKKIQSPNNPSESKPPKICQTKKIQSPNNLFESKPPKICKTKKIQSPNNPSESKPPKICKTKKIQSPNNPSESKPPKICKTKNIQSPNNPSESEPPNICQTKRTQSPNSPSQSKEYSTSKSVKLNNFLIIIKQSSSSFDTWQRICRINNVNGRYDVSQNYQYKASFYLDNVWVRDGTGKCEEKAKYSAAKNALVYFTKNQNIFVVDTTKVPEENMYSIDANYFVAIAKCDLKIIFRFHLNSFLDNHKMVKLELRNINACSHPLVENHFNEVASCFKLIKELQSKKERKTHRKSWFYKENSVTHKMDDFLLQYVTK